MRLSGYDNRIVVVAVMVVVMAACEGNCEKSAKRDDVEFIHYGLLVFDWRFYIIMYLKFAFFKFFW